MGKTFELSALLKSLTNPALPLAGGDDLIDEMIVSPLPRYPKFSLANVEEDLHNAAPKLGFRVFDLSYDPKNESNDGFDVQRLCVNFQPAADVAIVAPLVMNAIRAEYDRKGMRLDPGELEIEYSPNPL